MSTSKEPMLAILSMDSYNRGYCNGITGVGNQIGNVTLFIESDITENRAARNAGFYRASHAVANNNVAGPSAGGAIKSYRGTDGYGDLGIYDPANLVELLLDDFPLAFYRDFNEPSVHFNLKLVREVESIASGDSIITTVHSLGGALAGLVAGVNDVASLAVDPIDFFPALQNLK